MRSISRDIEKNEYKRAYLLFGEEDYLKDVYKNRLKDAVTAGDDLNFNRFEGTDADTDEIIALADTMPFFAERRLILIEDSGLFKKGGEKLSKHIGSLPETAVIVFCEKNVDKRSALFKAVSKHGYACEMKTQQAGALVPWVEKGFAGNGKKIARRDAAYLIDMTGTGMTAISNEIEKIVCYMGERSTVRKEDIDAVTNATVSAGIFDMIAAMAGKNERRTMRLYEQLILKGESPMGVLYMLSRQFSNMYRAKELYGLGCPRPVMAKKMNISEYAVKKCLEQGARFPADALEKAFLDCVETEEAIKNGDLGDGIGVEMLLAKFSAP